MNIFFWYILFICFSFVSLTHYLYIHVAIRYIPLVLPISLLLLFVPKFLRTRWYRSVTLVLLVRERESRAECVIIDVSLGGRLWFRTLPIKYIWKLFYYPERYVCTDKTIYCTLIKKNFLSLIITGQSIKHWIIFITLSTPYVKFDCFRDQAPTSTALRGGQN